MTRSMTLRSAGIAALLLIASPALADEAGGAPGKPPNPVTGEQVYRTVCQACHMADGKGGSGAAAIPALAGNPKLAASAYPITLVLNGKGAMPWLGDLLTPAQIAQVIGYVRTNFGNSYAKPVTEAEVKQMATALGRHD